MKAGTGTFETEMEILLSRSSFAEPALMAVRGDAPGPGPTTTKSAPNGQAARRNVTAVGFMSVPYHRPCAAGRRLRDGDGNVGEPPGLLPSVEQEGQGVEGAHR